jgi:hypothetical protein
LSNRCADGVAFEPQYPPFIWFRGSRRTAFLGRLGFWIVIWIAYTVVFKYWVAIPWTNAVLMTVVLHVFAVACDGVRLVRWRRSVRQSILPASPGADLTRS